MWWVKAANLFSAQRSQLSVEKVIRKLTAVIELASQSEKVRFLFGADLGQRNEHNGLHFGLKSQPFGRTRGERCSLLQSLGGLTLGPITAGQRRDTPFAR